MTERASHLGGSQPFLPDGRPFRVTGVVFDFDGTLTKPGALDFAAIHQAVGCPRGIGLLEFLTEIGDPEERLRKEAILNAAEAEAARRCKVNEGAAELVSFLGRERVPLAIITRNSREAVDLAFANLPEIDPSDFAVVLTRDFPLSPKPLPDGVQFVARELGLDAGGLLVIGDHSFDIESGKRAGALTMFLRNGNGDVGEASGADFVVDTLGQAGEIIRYGLPLPVGKFPAEMLEEGLAIIEPRDPALLVGSALGEDAAAVDISDAAVLVLASDPITLAADSMARYAVQVNANDVATSGATPRWLLCTLLFPPGSSASEVLAMTRDIQTACVSCGVSLCGGHTEISDAVVRPLVIGTMAGTVGRGGLLDKKGMKEGDRVLLTKGVAVEGTGLIAREHSARLLAGGMTAAEIAESGEFLERIGIVEEARVARAFAGVTAMHDVTEGGLATAVRELGAAGGRRLRLRFDSIPVYPLTRRICDALDLDPLGLIGSGSLLITCSPSDADRLLAALAKAGIKAADIGEVLDRGEGVEAFRGGQRAEWPTFSRDEVFRLCRT